MGQVPAVWEVRHSDDEEKAQKQKNRQSRAEEKAGEEKEKGEETALADGLLRSDDLGSVMASPASVKNMKEKTHASSRKPPPGMNAERQHQQHQQHHHQQQQLLHLGSSTNSQVSGTSRRLSSSNATLYSFSIASSNCRAR